MQLRLDIARALRGERAESLEARAIVAALAAQGIALEPVRAGTVEPESASYFRLEAPSLEAAESVVAALRAAAVVEAAYPEPPASPP